MSNKTQEEKIDYIYNHIKTERKFIYGRRIFKFLVYAFFIGYMYYFYMYGFQKLLDRIIEAVKPNISAENIVDGMKDSSGDLLQKAKDLYLEKLNGSQGSNLEELKTRESY